MPSVGGGGWSHCRSSGSAMRLCSGRVQQSQTGTVGGEGTKKYNKFTHRLNVGVEHWQMHRRAPAPKQEQRVNKKQKKSQTVTLKKFQNPFEKIPLVSKTSQNWVDIS